MSARKIKKSWWIDIRFQDERIRKRSPENTKAGAEAYEALVRSRLGRGEPLEAPKKTVTQAFGVFAEEWFNMHVVTNNKPSTQCSSRMILDGHLIGFFGGKSLDAVTAEEIERYKASKLQTGLSPKTVNNHLAVLGKCLKTAVEWNRIPFAPRLRLLKAPPQKFDFLGSVESARLTASFSDSHWQAMAICAIRSGMRMGELLGLRWEDVDFERRQLSVRRSIVRGVVASPKSNKARHIPLAEDLLEVLAGLRPKSGYVFQQTNGEPMTRGMAWRAIQTACKGAGLRLIGWHVLRHTFASQLASEGVSIQIIQTLLGHSDMKMTMRYAHLAPSTLRGAIDVLQAAEKREIEKFRQPVGNQPFGESKINLQNDAVLQTLLR